MTAEVITLNSHHFRDPVATLRALADEVAEGKHGEISVIAIAMLSVDEGVPKLSTFGCGQKAEGALATLVFQEAVEITRKMVLGS